MLGIKGDCIETLISIDIYSTKLKIFYNSLLLVTKLFIVCLMLALKMCKNEELHTLLYPLNKLFNIIWPLCITLLVDSY